MNANLILALHLNFYALVSLPMLLKCLLDVYNSSTSLIKIQRAECEFA